jgi:hypothetical protein
MAAIESALPTFRRRVTFTPHSTNPESTPFGTDRNHSAVGKETNRPEIVDQNGEPDGLNPEGLPDGEPEGLADDFDFRELDDRCDDFGTGEPLGLPLGDLDLLRDDFPLLRGAGLGDPLGLPDGEPDGLPDGAGLPLGEPDGEPEGLPDGEPLPALSFTARSARAELESGSPDCRKIFLRALYSGTITRSSRDCSGFNSFDEICPRSEKSIDFASKNL